MIQIGDNGLATEESLERLGVYDWIRWLIRRSSAGLIDPMVLIVDSVVRLIPSTTVERCVTAAGQLLRDGLEEVRQVRFASKEVNPNQFQYELANLRYMMALLIELPLEVSRQCPGLSTRLTEMQKWLLESPHPPEEIRLATVQEALALHYRLDCILPTRTLEAWLAYTPTATQALMMLVDQEPQHHADWLRRCWHLALQRDDMVLLDLQVERYMRERGWPLTRELLAITLEEMEIPEVERIQQLPAFRLLYNHQAFQEHCRLNPE